MQIFRKNDRSHPAQVVAAQERTLLYKHEGCTSSVPSPGLKELFCEFWDLSVFVSHLDGILTSSVGPECVELISCV